MMNNPHMFSDYNPIMPSCCHLMLKNLGTGLGQAFMTTGENGDYEARVICHE